MEVVVVRRGCGRRWAVLSRGALGLEARAAGGLGFRETGARPPGSEGFEAAAETRYFCGSLKPCVSRPVPPPLPAAPGCTWAQMFSAR